MHGHELEGALHKANSSLEKGLALLSDTEMENGLSQAFSNIINGIGELKWAGDESKSNAEIAQKVILPLIDGFVILNASHDEITVTSDTPLHTIL